MSETPPPQPKQPSSDILGAPKPKATRYKRGLIIALVIGSAGFFSVALIYGLFHGPNTGLQAQQDNTSPNQGNTPQFGSFPSGGYAAVTARTPAASARTLAPVNGQPGAAAENNLQPENNGPTQPTDAQVAAEKALQSSIFFSNTTDQSVESQAQNAQAPLGSPNAGAATPFGSTAPAPPLVDPGQQGEKGNFLSSNAQSPISDYTGTPIQSPASPYEVQAGAVIPAALLTVINSDLPGDVTAQVTENVYDSATGNFLLIPQGAKLYGKYDSLISYGQNRALVVWNRLIFPNGKSIDLGGMIGTDPTGQSGLQDQVNRHIWGLTAALAAATLVSFGPSLALDISQNGSSGTTNIYTNPAQSLGQNVNNVGQEFVSKELNRPNTITIRAGWPLRVMVNKDLILTPYVP